MNIFNPRGELPSRSLGVNQETMVEQGESYFEQEN